MRRRALVILVPLALACAFTWAVFALPAYMVGIHQRAITQELAQWETEYDTISSRIDAVRTAGMLEYVQRYYVPGEGYRSTPSIEAALETQRQETVDALVASLRQFTKEDFGEDSAKWLAFIERSGVSEDQAPRK